MARNRTIQGYDPSVGRVVDASLGDLGFLGVNLGGEHYIVERIDYANGSTDERGLVTPQRAFRVDRFNPRTITTTASEVRNKELLGKIAMGIAWISEKSVE
ncbi:MAG: hypothetical protein NUV97_01770 [archaeon]|nr:hypothetical protein [archaeon]MCR4323681.1 hypothetical protein [Nanoarchaeota archaeon]